MAKIRYLLWDVDGTLLDFLAAEKAALKKLFVRYGFCELTDEMIARYSAINVKYWQALERNEITKQEVLVNRFVEFFTKEGLDPSRAAAFNDDYQEALGDTVVFCDDSYELVKELREQGFYQVAVSNGTKTAQEKKLMLSGFDRLLDGVFLSEVLGVEKPNVEFFDRVKESLGLDNWEECLIIGDSLTSDIRGGNNAGLKTCWYNPYHKKMDQPVQVDYEIHNLQELRKFL